MRFLINGKNVDVTDALRMAVEDKLSKLSKFFTYEAQAHIMLSVQKDRQKAEITIPMKGHIIRSEQESNDMYASIDLACAAIEKQLIKYKKKLIDKKQNANELNHDYFYPSEKNDVDDKEENIKIYRTKQFAIKPMDPEEACVQMDLLGHNFYVFLNEKTQEVNVVYKRKANSYGLIEPEID